MKKIVVTGLILLSAACATGEKQEAPIAHAQNTPHIDLMAVQHDLGMDVPLDWVGYREKRFDACRMAADLPNVPQCDRAFFVQVGVQLSCRPSDEAENSVLREGELTAVMNQDLQWQLGNASGRILTNSAGYGVILAITSRSMKSGRLRISTNKDFLIMPALQATHIVTPVSWCSPL